jgi:hypothetical protein
MATPDPNLTLVVVFESDDPVALNIAEASLEDAGIEFAVVDEALTGYGFSPILNSVTRIQVAQDSEAQAREIMSGLITTTASGVVEDIELAKLAEEQSPKAAEATGMEEK